MLKRTYAAAIAILLCSINAVAALYQVEDKDCRYVLDSSTKKASVQKFIGPSSRKTVSIPDNIMYDDGKTYTVTAIEDCAFMESNVVTVNFPSTLKTIGACAFQGCPRLAKGKEMVLPVTLTQIGMEAFQGCKFTSVKIPSTVTLIEESAFAGSSLKSVTFETPKSGLKIMEFAFQECKSLTAVTLPSKVTSLGQAAFLGCTALASVTFPGTLTSIPSRCFENCTALRTFAIPSGVKTVGWSAFQSSGLTSVSIPATVTKIEQQAFTNTGLTAVTIPSSVKTISWMCFSGCDNLATVNLPATLKTIDSGAFWECPKLMTIRCDAVTPPDVSDESCFSASSYAGATLQLPAASVAAYSKAEVWKKFNWFAQTGVDTPEVESGSIEYFTLQGTPVAADVLTPGVYVCRRGGKVSKIVVR